jgi:hypothetical protein
MNLPDYLIIGETKCGTTSLYNYLIKHPRIRDSYGNGDKVDPSYATKEIRFFDRYYYKGINWYRKCFPATNNGEITGEGTPMYMYRAMALYRIYKHLPDAKFVVLLRNPIDRLFSNYQHYYKYVSGWANKYTDFEAYLNKCTDPDYFMIDKGIYFQSLQRWFQFFPKEQFYIDTSENLRNNPQSVYSNILEFLGVEDYKLESYSYYRENEYNDMRKETRQMLRDFYQPYNEKLYSLLKMDLKWDK